ncbi:hypothetical protein D3C72_2127380 [compost metagenome]
MIQPAPSPNTNPSLSLSKGLEAVFGSSFLVESACIALKPPIPLAVTAASEPPQTITSALPKLISILASIKALADEAQAETVV